MSFILPIIKTLSYKKNITCHFVEKNISHKKNTLASENYDNG